MVLLNSLCMTPPPAKLNIWLLTKQNKVIIFFLGFYEMNLFSHSPIIVY